MGRRPSLLGSGLGERVRSIMSSGSSSDERAGRCDLGADIDVGSGAGRRGPSSSPERLRFCPVAEAEAEGSVGVGVGVGVKVKLGEDAVLLLPETEMDVGPVEVAITGVESVEAAPGVPADVGGVSSGGIGEGEGEGEGEPSDVKSLKGEPGSEFAAEVSTRRCVLPFATATGVDVTAAVLVGVASDFTEREGEGCDAEVKDELAGPIVLAGAIFEAKGTEFVEAFRVLTETPPRRRGKKPAAGIGMRAVSASKKSEMHELVFEKLGSTVEVIVVEPVWGRGAPRVGANFVATLCSAVVVFVFPVVDDLFGLIVADTFETLSYDERAEEASSAVSLGSSAVGPRLHGMFFCLQVLQATPHFSA